jgi:hypothetical protein
MKTITLLIVTIIFSLTAKAQHFGVTADVGLSRINKIYGYTVDAENKSKIYYGLGVFFAKIPLESIWGFRASLDYNKRGEGSCSEAFFGSYFDVFSGVYIDPVYITGEESESTKSLSLTFTPTLNASNNLQFVFGPTIEYTLGTKYNFKETSYKTEAKSEVLSSRTGTSEINGSSFTSRLHVGLKAGINVKVSNHVDLGLIYQYVRRFKYGNAYYRPFYNIINLTTTIYLKKRE